MFGRLNDVRLKAAEQALAGGRLDEAFDAATAADMVDRKRAAAVLARLFEPLLTRAQEHLLDRRFREALADLEKAGRCGVGAEKVAEWRARAVAAMEDFQRKARTDRAALEAAEDRLGEGALTLAAENLDRVADGGRDRGRLEGEIAAASERAKRLAEEARAAMKAEQYSVAVERLVAAKRNHAASEAVLDVSEALARRLIERVREALSSGQLDRAAHDLELARRVDASRPEVAEAARAMEWVRGAAEQIAAGRYDEALLLLGRFTQLAGGAAWAKKAREHLEEIRTRLAEVAQGPLGIVERPKSPAIAEKCPVPSAQRPEIKPGQSPVMAGDGKIITDPHETLVKPRRDVAVVGVPPIIARPVDDADASALPRRMVLRIDGVGSYLLLRSERIVIGRAGGVADLPIQADLSERQAEIVRSGEDYFLIGNAGVELAGAQVRQALLSHGDKIRLGRRVRLTFERPSRKSPTASLVLGDGVRSLTDVKRVILWSGPILLGPTTDCHIPVHGLLTGMVLVERAGRIQLRPMGTGGVGQVITVSMGQVIEAGPMRFSVQTAK